MRQSQKQNRSRGKNNRKPNGGGYSPNRVYESSGPEGKVRGTPQQIIEKYQSLARDKATAGDRVMAESFLQHAEHYMRILTASQPVQQRREDASADDREIADAEAGADPLAVIGGEDGEGAEIVQTPESMGGGGGGRGRRRSSDDADGEGEQRRPRRGRRRERSREDQEASAEGEADGASQAAADGFDDESSESVEQTPLSATG